MLTSQQKAVLAHLHREGESPFAADVSDGVLLERFLGLRDAEAFATLVRRHGAMVLGVCRRVLHSAHDADDAFQATFLVLIEKARSIARREALGSWLYGVAYRVALKARADVRRRQQVENAAEERVAQDSNVEAIWPILDEEVSRLPDKYRRPIVLCYFEGKTYQEAARLLGWPPGTASVRLARAREMLRNRLTRRGLAPSAAAVGAALTAGTAQAGQVFMRADALAGVASRWLSDPARAAVTAPVIALTEGVVKEMLLTKLRTLAGMLVVIALTVVGSAALWRSAATAPAAAAEPPGEAAAAPLRTLAAPLKDAGRPLQSRIGLINMTRALVGSKRYQAMKADVDQRSKEALQRLDSLNKEIKTLQADCDDPATPAARREEYNRRLQKLKREGDDEQDTARARLTRMSGDAATAMYRAVEEAADRVAKLKGLELVLFYTDAITEADFYSPPTIQRKMSQPGALIPMIAAPGMDITEAVIEALNTK
jgi:RNA polymerase sigma factor (sigma-70 family)